MTIDITELAQAPLTDRERIIFKLLSAAREEARLRRKAEKQQRAEQAKPKPVDLPVEGLPAALIARLQAYLLSNPGVAYADLVAMASNGIDTQVGKACVDAVWKGNR